MEALDPGMEEYVRLLLDQKERLVVTGQGKVQYNAEGPNKISHS